MALTTIDLKEKVGVELQAPREEFLGGDHADNIRDLLEERGVVIIRGIHLSDDEQVQFARTLGETQKFGDMEIFTISLDPNQSMAAEYLKGSLLWHIDGAMDDVPSRGSILTAHKLPETREGNTEVANTFTAFQDLPEAEREKLENLNVVHTMAASQRRVYPDATEEQRRDWEENHSPKTHPLVWTHQSGRKSLLTGVSADYIEGMDLDEGRALLEKLDAHCTRDEYVYSHEWNVGDLLIWDNTVSLHRAAPYSPTSGRLMHRVTILGEEPVR